MSLFIVERKAWKWHAKICNIEIDPEDEYRRHRRRRPHDGLPPAQFNFASFAATRRRLARAASLR